MTTDRNCLDAETLAAWMDGGLDPAAAAAAEAHASTCERCQALLATVVKTLPADPVVSGFSRIDTGTRRLWQWWFAPLAATAAAVTIWMVVPQDPMERPPAAAVVEQQVAREAARDTAVPQARKERAEAAEPTAGFAPVPPAAPVAPPAPAGKDQSDLRRNAPAEANEAKAKADADANNAVGKLTGAAGARADQEAQSAKREQAPQAAEMRERLEAPAAPASAPAERFRAGATPPPAAPAPPALSAVSQLKKQAPPVIVSPDATSQWRANTPGSIERSEDGGRTWIPVRIAVKEEILSGASPARLVCWLVGRSGLVLLATDGTNFTRLPFPESVDLVSVSSPEARIAIVTTADGRTFRTEDGGRNWRNP